MTFRLTAFADEISPDLNLQLETLTRLGVGGLDLRNVFGKNVSTLSDDDAKDAFRQISDAGIAVACIGSPVNKVPLQQELFTSELDKLKRCLEVAHIVQAPCLRLFTPETVQPGAEFATEIFDWMTPMVALAEDANIVLLHENDAHFWGAYPECASILFKHFNSPYFRAAFDFANTVLIGFRPMSDWFPWLLPHLHTLHIKDAIQAEGKVVPAGIGEGQLVDTLRYLVSQGWSGPLTLEPHLSAAGAYGGFSGVELFEVATSSLREVIAKVLEP
jgi:sugar phosphate isomerase/epimerase